VFSALLVLSDASSFFLFYRRALCGLDPFLREFISVRTFFYYRLPDARRQATPEWSINSTGAGGANNTGVTRELHGYFGPFARANIQMFHLVYDDDQHLPSSIHPVKVAIVTVI
jgi:hypothetical protein